MKEKRNPTSQGTALWIFYISGYSDRSYKWTHKFQTPKTGGFFPFSFFFLIVKEIGKGKEK